MRTRLEKPIHAAVPLPGDWVAAMRRTLAAALVILTPLAALPSGATEMTAAGAVHQPRPVPDSCVLCAGDSRTPVVPLSPAWLDSLARSHASYNVREIARIDSLFRTGHLGSTKSSLARRSAHLLTRLTTINAYRDLVWLASDPTTVHEASEATLADLNKRYSDVLLFSTARLVSVRLGLGRVCMRYSVDGQAEGKSIHGGKTLRWRIKDLEIEGQSRRLLSLELPTGTDDTVEVLLARHHSFAVEYSRVDGPPGPFELFLVDDIQGGWLQKWGTHQPRAYMFWVSALAPGAESYQDGSIALPASYPNVPSSPVVDLPETPLVGVRVYIPGLRLRMPFFPDVNFDDLREVELPLPILSMEYLKKKQQPSWLGTADNSGLKDWKGYGSVPPGLRERFPDY